MNSAVSIADHSTGAVHHRKLPVTLTFSWRDYNETKWISVSAWFCDLHQISGTHHSLVCHRISPIYGLLGWFMEIWLESKVRTRRSTRRMTTSKLQNSTKQSRSNGKSKRIHKWELHAVKQMDRPSFKLLELSVRPFLLRFPFEFLLWRRSGWRAKLSHWCPTKVLWSGIPILYTPDS